MKYIKCLVFVALIICCVGAQIHSSAKDFWTNSANQNSLHMPQSDEEIEMPLFSQSDGEVDIQEEIYDPNELSAGSYQPLFQQGFTQLGNNDDDQIGALTYNESDDPNERSAGSEQPFFRQGFTQLRNNDDDQVETSTYEEIDDPNERSIRNYSSLFQEEFTQLEDNDDDPNERSISNVRSSKILPNDKNIQKRAAADNFGREQTVYMPKQIFVNLSEEQRLSNDQRDRSVFRLGYTMPIEDVSDNHPGKEILDTRLDDALFLNKDDVFEMEKKQLAEQRELEKKSSSRSMNDDDQQQDSNNDDDQQEDQNKKRRLNTPDQVLYRNKSNTYGSLRTPSTVAQQRLTQAKEFLSRPSSRSMDDDDQQDADREKRSQTFKVIFVDDNAAQDGSLRISAKELDRILANNKHIDHRRKNITLSNIMPKTNNEPLQSDNNQKLTKKDIKRLLGPRLFELYSNEIQALHKQGLSYDEIKDQIVQEDENRTAIFFGSLLYPRYKSLIAAYRQAGKNDKDIKKFLVSRDPNIREINSFKRRFQFLPSALGPLELSQTLPNLPTARNSSNSSNSPKSPNLPNLPTAQNSPKSPNLPNLPTARNLSESPNSPKLRSLVSNLSLDNDDDYEETKSYGFDTFDNSSDDSDNNSFDDDLQGLLD